MRAQKNGKAEGGEYTWRGHLELYHVSLGAKV